MARMLRQGLIQIYTGDGKGKTTAALGLALRAAGAGLKTCVIQFVKANAYSEIKALKKVPNIKIEQCGRGCFVKGAPQAKDIKCAGTGMKMAAKALASGKYDIVVLDEANVAMKLGLIGISEMLALIEKRPDSVELVLTGRGCPEAIMRLADLVTEMKEVRHPHRRGLAARKGIEY